MKENVTGSLEWSGWVKEVAELVIHESAEDYLESILILQEQRGEVHSIDIVNRLGYSKPSVSIAMKKLRGKRLYFHGTGWRHYAHDSGLEIASRVYTRHKVLTELFVRLGVSGEQAAEDACRVEHDLSQETFARIQEFVQQKTL